MKSRLAASPTGHSYRQSRRNRSTAMGLVFFTLLLLAIGGTRWFLDRGYVIGVTPTVTPTARVVTHTPTVDFRATQNAEEVAFQNAMRPSPGVEIPTPEPTDTPSPTPTETPTLVGVPPDPSAENTDSVISLPIIGSAGGNASPTPSTLITTPTSDPGVSATETSTAPTDTSPIDVPPTDENDGVTIGAATWTAVPTATPTETPTATWTPAPLAQPTVLLQAFTQRPAAVHLGPSSLYTKTADLAADQRVILRGRDVAGEWIYLCCEQDIEGWTQQANLSLRNNELPPNAPPNSTPDDVRWLLERQPTITSLTPVPVATPIPAGDFPLYRGNRAAQAHIEQTFLSSLRLDWSDVAQASGAFSSPVIVAGASVMVASEDLELYSFEKSSGRQRWREKFEQVVRHAPAVQDQFVYVVDSAGTVRALLDQGNTVVRQWTVRLDTAPRSGPNIYNDRLFIAGANNVLYVLNRFNGAQVQTIGPNGSNLQYPAIGSQLLYVGNSSLQAIDIFNYQVVWEDNEHFTLVSAPPVYSQPGVLALAEVYAADSGGNIYALDANTGRLLWTHVSGERVEMLALDNSTVYAAGQNASGQNFIKALNRTDGVQRWRNSLDLNEQMIGGPIIGQGRLFFAVASGTIRVLDAFQGGITSGASIPTGVGGQPAASEGRVFIPGIDGTLYAFFEDS